MALISNALKKPHPKNIQANKTVTNVQPFVFHEHVLLLYQVLL